MSDGGGKENVKEFYEQNSARKPAGKQDFVRALVNIAVAQVCESEGFQGFQQSALEALADVAIRYVREIGKTANLAANLAGRSECNVLDAIQGLEDLGSVQGFPGASDVHHSLGSSGIIGEISQYLSLTAEIPFVYSLPEFPVSRERKPPPSFCQLGEEPPGEHVPAWLPAFPYSQSHVDLAACNGVETGRGEGHGKTPREEELPHLVMQHGLTSNGSKGVFSLDLGDPFKTKEAADVNPFLAPPLLYGEKEVSSIYHPSRFSDVAAVANHVNVIEPFAITTEVPQKKLSETEVRNNNIRLVERPVQLKFSSVRKSLPMPRNVITRENEDERLVNCFGMDDEKDEKKQRAEQILKESMENP